MSGSWRDAAMESRGSRGSEREPRRWPLIALLIAMLLLALILAIVLGVTLSRRQDPFKAKFLEKCQEFGGHDCQHILDAFKQAYVNQDPCEVPPEAYDQLIAAAPMESLCNRSLFWSKTKKMAQEIAGKKDCLKTVEKTFLGFVLDGMTWCGEKGSNETLTTNCPGWTVCENNPVRSFWRRVSTAFGDAACGNVTAMLNGSLTSPFDSDSVFATIEVKRFKSPRVKNLNVVLVMPKNSVTNCTNKSLQTIKMVLDEGIAYSCLEVPYSKIEECTSDPQKPCGACW